MTKRSPFFVIVPRFSAYLIANFGVGAPHVASTVVASAARAIRRTSVFLDMRGIFAKATRFASSDRVPLAVVPTRLRRQPVDDPRPRRLGDEHQPIGVARM